MIKIHPVILLFLGIILVFLSIYVFTRPAIWSNFDFSNTGQIGDTIGGISAPVINLIGALLIYFSFKEQFEANRIQRESLDNEILRNRESKEFDLLFSLFKEIKNEVENFEFYETQRYVDRISDNVQIVESKYKGLPAIETFILHVEKSIEKKRNYQTISEQAGVKYIIGSLRDLHIKIDDSGLNINDKELLKSKLQFFYEAKLQTLIESLLKVNFKEIDFLNFVEVAHAFLKRK
jgi:hypothetical protein